MEDGVAVGEDAAVRRHQPVAAPVRGSGHPHHGLGEADGSGRAVEDGVAVGEDTPVRRHQPVAARIGGPRHAHHGLGEVDGARRAVEGGIAEGEDTPVRRHQPVAVDAAAGLAGDGEPIRLHAVLGELRREGVTAHGHALGGSLHRHLEDPPTEVTQVVALRHPYRDEGADLRIGAHDGRHRDLGLPGVMRVARPRHAHRVPDVGNRGEGPARGVPARRRRVLGAGHGVVGHENNRVGRGGDGGVGLGALVGDARIVLARRGVADIRVAEVALEAPVGTHHVGPDGDGLRLELVEPEAAAQRRPRGRGLRRRHVGHVLPEGQHVHGPGGVGGVDRPLQRPAYRDVVRQLAQLQRRHGDIAREGLRARYRRRGRTGDPGGHRGSPVPVAATPSGAREHVPQVSGTDQFEPSARQCGNHRPVDEEPRVRGDDDIVAGVGGERHGDGRGGVGPTVGHGSHRGLTAGAERPVVRAQDLGRGEPRQRIAERPPLAHSGPRSISVAGQRDAGEGVGGRGRGRCQGEQTRESRQDHDRGDDACDGAAPSGGSGVDSADGSHIDTHRGGRPCLRRLPSGAYGGATMVKGT